MQTRDDEKWMKHTLGYVLHLSWGVMWSCRCFTSKWYLFMLCNMYFIFSLHNACISTNCSNCHFCLVQVLGEQEGEVGLSPCSHEHLGWRSRGLPTQSPSLLSKTDHSYRHWVHFQNQHGGKEFNMLWLAFRIWTYWDPLGFVHMADTWGSSHVDFILFTFHSTGMRYSEDLTINRGWNSSLTNIWILRYCWLSRNFCSRK